MHASSQNKKVIIVVEYFNNNMRWHYSVYWAYPESEKKLISEIAFHAPARSGCMVVPFFAKIETTLWKSGAGLANGCGWLSYIKTTSICRKLSIAKFYQPLLKLNTLWVRKYCSIQYFKIEMTVQHNNSWILNSTFDAPVKKV